MAPTDTLPLNDRQAARAAAWRTWERSVRLHNAAEARGDLLAMAVLEGRTAGILSPVQLLRERQAAR
jgi:hypothetical protein